jgi:hypothetical protein
MHRGCLNSPPPPLLVCEIIRVVADLYYVSKGAGLESNLLQAYTLYTLHVVILMVLL